MNHHLLLHQDCITTVISLHPATPQSPKRPLALPPSANILPSESAIDQLFSSGQESVTRYQSTGLHSDKSTHTAADDPEPSPSSV